MCHRKMGRLLSADFCRSTKNIGQHVGKPAVLSSGILLCDWSAYCLQRWRPSIDGCGDHEINRILLDKSDVTWLNWRELQKSRFKMYYTYMLQWNGGVQDMKMLVSWPKLVFNSQHILSKKEVRNVRPTQQMCTQNIARGQSNLT